MIESIVISTYIFAAFFMALAIPAIASWRNDKISPMTISVGLAFGMVATIIIVSSLILMSVTIEPSLAIIILAMTIIGLIIGATANALRTRK